MRLGSGRSSPLPLLAVRGGAAILPDSVDSRFFPLEPLIFLCGVGSLRLPRLGSRLSPSFLPSFLSSFLLLGVNLLTSSSAYSLFDATFGAACRPLVIFLRLSSPRKLVDENRESRRGEQADRNDETAGRGRGQVRPPQREGQDPRQGVPGSQDRGAMFVVVLVIAVVSRGALGSRRVFFFSVLVGEEKEKI